MASPPPSPGPLSPEFRIPRLPTGAHTPSDIGNPEPGETGNWESYWLTDID